MPQVIPLADAGRLRSFFNDTGYTESNLKGLGFRDLASSRLRNMPRLLYKTQEPTPLNTLLRWFWLGITQNRAEAGKQVSNEVVGLLLACGLLSEENGQLAPQAMLMEAAGFLIASDYTAKIDHEDPELVLWPNPTSRLLLRMAIRRHSRMTLDLGAGTGIQAMAAAAHSDRVIATDLSPRAVEFAVFNARLNGISNIEVLAGDGFEPVAGWKFDLIVSNPPFFISPSSKYLFCNNRLELDQLCRKLIRESPEFLEEGGFFEMLCEWAEVQGESWQERIGSWLRGTGCDGWVVKAYTRDPAEYAEEQIRSTVSNPQRDAESFAEYMDYYRRLGVRFIHGGTIVMRRRSGENWIAMDEITQLPKQPFGDAMLEIFAARDFLQNLTDDALLNVTPRLSPHVRLEQTLERDSGKWRSVSLNLKMSKEFSSTVGVQPLVAEFLSECDGTQSLGDVIAKLSMKVNAPREQVRAECSQVVRRLLERGFLLH